MNIDELKRRVSAFEELLKRSEKVQRIGKRNSLIEDGVTTRPLIQLYSMMCAFRIRQSVYPNEMSQLDKQHLIPVESLPAVTALQEASHMLYASIEAADGYGISRALDDMGINMLCPSLADQPARLEMIAESQNELARLVFLVELALFAIEREAYDDAAKYAQRAHALDPISFELYCICNVEGLIAAKEHRIDHAAQCLIESIDACQVDERTSLHCGTRLPNLSLARMLLESGERAVVLKYLMGCRNVWQFLAQRIDEWISSIELGVKVEFPAEFLQWMDRLSSRLLYRSIDVRFFARLTLRVAVRSIWLIAMRRCFSSGST